jgi:hypothetical protein
MEILRRAMPTQAQEAMIVRLWERREERKPDPITAAKYPADIRKKRNPAPPWPIPKSLSTVGRKGARIILAVKFKKKISARKRTGPVRRQKSASRPFWFSPAAGWLFEFFLNATSLIPVCEPGKPRRLRQI